MSVVSLFLMSGCSSLTALKDRIVGNKVARQNNCPEFVVQDCSDPVQIEPGDSVEDLGLKHRLLRTQYELCSVKHEFLKQCTGVEEQ